MTATARPIFAYLSDVPSVRALARLPLGEERVATVWSNSASRASYPDPHGHTFSLYLEGGEATRRTDRGGTTGFPGAVCVLPQGCPSHWEIGAPFRFVHYYAPDSELRRAYAETFDRDARLMSLPEITQEDRPTFAAPLRALANAATEGDALAADGAVSDLVRALFADMAPAPRLRGGLAPAARRRCRDMIEADARGDLRLADLAQAAGLSPFHFARAFAESFGAPPHRYVGRRKIERAKAMLRRGDSIAFVAEACGFSSQSHFTRAFVKAAGATPARWRAGRITPPRA